MFSTMSILLILLPTYVLGAPVSDASSNSVTLLPANIAASIASHASSSTTPPVDLLTATAAITNITEKETSNPVLGTPESLIVAYIATPKLSATETLNPSASPSSPPTPSALGQAAKDTSNTIATPQPNIGWIIGGIAIGLVILLFAGISISKYREYKKMKANPELEDDNGHYNPSAKWHDRPSYGK